MGASILVVYLFESYVLGWLICMAKAQVSFVSSLWPLLWVCSLSMYISERVWVYIESNSFCRRENTDCHSADGALHVTRPRPVTRAGGRRWRWRWLAVTHCGWGGVCVAFSLRRGLAPNATTSHDIANHSRHVTPLSLHVASPPPRRVACPTTSTSTTTTIIMVTVRNPTPKLSDELYKAMQAILDSLFNQKDAEFRPPPLQFASAG